MLGCICAETILGATILALVAYESVAERFFAEANVNHFLLEYDTARTGDFASLRFVPRNQGGYGIGARTRAQADQRQMRDRAPAADGFGTPTVGGAAFCQLTVFSNGRRSTVRERSSPMPSL